MKISAGKKVYSVKDCRGISCAWGLMFDYMKRIDGALVRGSSMWMPFVKHELDLFFLDKDMRIAKIQRAVPMILDPETWKTYSCSGAKYCLEMKKGECKAKVGMKIRIMGSAGIEPAASCV